MANSSAEELAMDTERRLYFIAVGQCFLLTRNTLPLPWKIARVDAGWKRSATAHDGQIGIDNTPSPLSDWR